MSRHLGSENHANQNNPQKHIIAMVGYPGTGKSTIAKSIFRADNRCLFLNRDVLRIGRGVRAMANNGHDTLRVDKVFFQAARDALQAEHVVIMDATFREFEKRLKVYEIAKSLNCRVTLIHCVSSDEAVLSRLRFQKNRMDKRFRKDLNSVLNYYKSNFEPLVEDTKFANIIIADTENEMTTIHSALHPPIGYLDDLQILINRSYRFIREHYEENLNHPIPMAALQCNGQALNGTATYRTTANERTDLTVPALNSRK